MKRGRRRCRRQVLRPLERSIRFSQEQRLATIGLLANGVAHEIHNPLASIRLALQASLRGLKAKDISHEELVEYLELVDDQIDRAVLATDRLMQMSHPPGEDPEPVALSAAVDDVLANYGKGRLIFNLGHGITPEGQLANVERLVARVRAGGARS